MENNDQDTLQALDESNSKWVEGWRKAAKKITFDMILPMRTQTNHLL